MSWITDEVKRRQSEDTHNEAEALKKAKEMIAAEAAIAELKSYIRTENDHLPKLVRLVDGVAKDKGVTFDTLSRAGNGFIKSRVMFQPAALVVSFFWNDTDSETVIICYQSDSQGYLLEHRNIRYRSSNVVHDMRLLASTVVQSVVTGDVRYLTKLLR